MICTQLCPGCLSMRVGEFAVQWEDCTNLELHLSVQLRISSVTCFSACFPYVRTYLEVVKQHLFNMTPSLLCCWDQPFVMLTVADDVCISCLIRIVAVICQLTFQVFTLQLAVLCHIYTDTLWLRFDSFSFSCLLMLEFYFWIRFYFSYIWDGFIHSRKSWFFTQH